MKRITCIILGVLLLMMCFVSASAATGASLTLTPSATSLARGAELAVTVSLQGCADGQAIALLFDYDTDSVFEVVSGAWKLPESPPLIGFDKETTKAGTAVAGYAGATDMNGTVFVLKLKVKSTAPTGTAAISVTPTIKNGSAELPCTAASVNVTITAAGCQHTSKSPVTAQTSTCNVRGWDAYCQCDTCSQFFTGDGETPLDGIPYRPFGAHTYTAKTENAAAMKTPATASQNAVCYYSCSVCGACEHDDSHTFVGQTLYGDANGDNKISTKDIVRIKNYLAAYDYDTETSTVILGSTT